MTLSLPRRGRCLSTAAVALALVGASTTAAHADGSGTVADPWVPAKTARIVCNDATRFGNYQPGSHDLQTPIDTVHAGDHIAVRYETADRYAVNAKYSDADTKWGFILRSCVQFY